MLISPPSSWRRVAAIVLTITGLLLQGTAAQEQAAKPPAPTQKPFLWRFEVGDSLLTIGLHPQQGGRAVRRSTAFTSDFRDPFG